MHRRAFAVLLALGAFAIAPAAAAAWAPAETAPIHPGVMTFTDGGQCTSNFILTRGAPVTDVYIGQAAHCSGTGAATETNGCDSASLPLGTPVEIDGASQPGTMVYNSWIAMQQAGERDQETCDYNDFALVKIHPDDVAKVNPSVPHWGGPTGIGTASTIQTVYTYGNSSLRLGVTALSPKTGKVAGRSARGWSYDVYTVTPGIPGDSGSAFVNRTGQALGVLATVQLAPLVGSNGVGDFGKQLAYARRSISGLELALATEPFTAGPLN